MMNLVTLMLQIACFAFLAWGGMLSLKCLTQPGGIGFPSREPKAA